jgi:hypothetical protein
MKRVSFVSIDFRCWSYKMASYFNFSSSLSNSQFCARTTLSCCVRILSCSLPNDSSNYYLLLLLVEGKTCIDLIDSESLWSAYIGELRCDIAPASLLVAARCYRALTKIRFGTKEAKTKNVYFATLPILIHIIIYNIYYIYNK